MVFNLSLQNHDQSGLTWVLFAVVIMVKSPRNSLFMGVPGVFFRRVKYSTNFQHIFDYILIKETAVYRLSCLFTTVSFLCILILFFLYHAPFSEK